MLELFLERVLLVVIGEIIGAITTYVIMKRER